MASSSEQPEPAPLPSASPEATGIQTSADAPPLPLPPAPKPPPLDAAKLLRLCGALDWGIVAVVLLFAFAVASFPASNPDFFGQAATGRLILEGKYQFGVDPFVYSAEESDYFVNHSWLFAVLMYGLYQIPTFGGAIVVIFKALLIAALAEILLRASRRPGQSLWIPAACTALAILVLCPRLYLQPSCLSFLFLGVTLWLLIAARSGKQRLLWLLPPLFALWVNCDQWFFLGPLTLALYLGGELLQLQFSLSHDPQGSESEALRFGSRLNENPPMLLTLGVVLAVGVAACLLNPHHIHAFTLPPELGLSAAGELIENDPQFHSLFLSPLRKDYYSPYLGLNAAGLAYWPLLLLGLTSFVLVFGRVPWWRLLVWMGFALLSLYNVRAIPFFAIVSGPIMALNWQDYAAEHLGPAPPLTTGRRKWALGGRVLTLLLGVVLLLAAAPGWLHNQPQTRRLGWSVAVNPSLQAMAETIHDWRASGRLGSVEPHWFNMHYEIAYYLAYFAPGERVYFDQGITQFRTAAKDYQDIRQGLAQMVVQQAEMESTPAARKDWQRILRERNVHFWIFDNLFVENLNLNKAELIARLYLFSFPKEWVLCYLDGRIAIFAWRDPKQSEAPDPSAGLTLDLKRAAFGPQAKPAPPRGPEPTPPQSWWESLLDVWWPATPARAIDADSASMYEFRYLLQDERQENVKYTEGWRHGIAAAAVVNSLANGPVPNNPWLLSWCATLNELLPVGATGPARQVRPFEEQAIQAWYMYVNGQFYETPSLYLALRAARRALLANPEDGSTAFLLAQIYLRLRNLPHERNFQRTDPLLSSIRNTQMTGAYQNCLRLPIDDDKAAQAHAALCDHFRQVGFLDATVHHLREALNKRRTAGPRAGMSVTEHNRVLDQMSDQLAKLDAELERRMDRYKVNAASKTGLDQVKAALQEGLTETALEVLLQTELSNPTPAEAAFVKQVAGVALDMGRLDLVYHQLLPDPEGEPVNPEDLTLYLRLAAARGDYAEAQQLLAAALQPSWKSPQSQRQPLDMRAQVGLLLGNKLLGEAQRITGLLSDGRRFTGPLRTPWVPNKLEDFVLRSQVSQNPTDFWLRRWPLEALVNGMLIAQQPAEWHLLSGWLALESGHCVEARKHFRAVRSLAVPGEIWLPEVNGLNAWLFPQEEIKRMNQLGFRHSVLEMFSARYLDWLEEAQ